MRKIYDVIQWLSLDVTLGAWASGGMVAWWLQVPMDWTWWVGLPLAVWVVYTTDHLLDAWRLKAQASTARHLFHYRFRHYLIPLCGVGAIGGMTLAYFLPLPILLTGGGIAVLVAIHLLLVKLIGDRTSLFFHKEVGVGVIFTCGIWAGPWTIAPHPHGGIDMLLAVQYFLLVMINLLIFSNYELAIDEKDGHTSFVRALGQNRTLWIIGGLGGTLILLLVFLLLTANQLENIWEIQTIYLLMLALLWWISFHPQLFGQQEGYRLWGDMVFIFPILHLVL
ncbi:MAG: hypothetical protein AAFR59_07805 [Bacteroidota bacterium]